MKSLKIFCVGVIVMVASIMMVACKDNKGSELNFEVGFSKSVLGDGYYVGSHLSKSLAELNSLVGEFEFTDVAEKYNEIFL